MLLGANFPPKPTGLNLFRVRRGSGLCVGDASRVSQSSPLRRFLFAPKAHLILTLGVRGACANLVCALYEVFLAEVFLLNLFCCGCNCVGVDLFAHTLKLSDLQLPMVRLLPLQWIHHPGEVLQHLSNRCYLCLSLEFPTEFLCIATV